MVSLEYDVTLQNNAAILSHVTQCRIGESPDQFYRVEWDLVVRFVVGRAG